MIYHRMFLTTIDVQLSQKINQRFEVSSKPGFIDLRNPRLLKLIGCNTPEPAIDLDNRYRLMRHEQMLDAQGNPTDKFIKDSRVYAFEEFIEIHNLNQ
ncbi:uncharacterized protein LOC141525449 [Cotesia typhae]|uniref:uncharacterized protein LOC141525449 n=1 Tax=Cotesia typhae TaxID=2053667 RepID=UPI003D69A2A4